MSTIDLAVLLIGVLCLLNAVAVVALIRQVGILHLRLAPVAGLQGAGGPAYGQELQLPAAVGELARREASRYLVGFVSPTCGICGPLTTAFGKVAKSADADTAVVLVVDAGERDAAAYVRSKGAAAVSYLADSATFTANVPGAPWAVVTNGDGVVMTSGGVNTLDNIEEMLALAAQVMADPPVAFGDEAIVVAPSSQSMEA